MSDNEAQPGGNGDDKEPQSTRSEFWYGIVEFVGWSLEFIVWLVRVLVAGVVALLHSCS